MMLTIDEGRKAIRFAWEVISTHLIGKKMTKFKLPLIFRKNRGAFVTIYTYPNHELRGCIGIPQPIMSLEEALKEAAVSVTRDPRFHPLRKEELSSIIVEVTVLTKPEPLVVETVEEYPKKIKIGRDGLIIEYLGRSGLLLPQVPVEYGWDAEEFLLHLCLKAGLPPDTWFDSKAKIFKFSGQIFFEIEPRGPVEEKQFNDI